MMISGTPVESAAAWMERRRPELLELFRVHEYGQLTPFASTSVWSGVTVNVQALNDLATRKEVRIGVSNDADGTTFNLLLYIPNSLRRRGMAAPLFIGLNFFGNHTICSDQEVTVPTSWIPNNSKTKGQPASMLRGIQSPSWPIDYILNRGYGLATAYCGDIVPDRVDGVELAIDRWFRGERMPERRPDSWGAIAGWAWGLSRAMDYLCHDPDVDAKRIVVIGHSRLGKAALWAGAQDERFAMVVSNNSGCGGAALARRKFGERLADINCANPHWFCENFKRFNHREEALPVDQHELIALIAPRPVYIGSAQLDLAADPMGEFLSARYASCVYKLLGKAGLPACELPAAGTSVMDTIGYHIRTGQHGITLFDWKQYIAFANLHLRYANRN